MHCALLLGLVHRGVGALDELFGADLLAARAGDADARAAARRSRTTARSCPHSASAMRRAARIAMSSPRTSRSTTRNSSPPRRPIRSVSRLTCLRRSATRIRSSSPAAWPSVSLTGLNWSRSTYTVPVITSSLRSSSRCSALDDRRAVVALRERVEGGALDELLARAGAVGDVEHAADRAADLAAVAHQCAQAKERAPPRARGERDVHLDVMVDSVAEDFGRAPPRAPLCPPR